MATDTPKMGKKGESLPICTDSDFAKQNSDLMNTIKIDNVAGKLSAAKPRNVKTVNDLIK